VTSRAAGRLTAAGTVEGMDTIHPDPSEQRLPGIVATTVIASWDAIAAGHLGGRGDATHRSYRQVLDQWAPWCAARQLNPLVDVQRLHAQAYLDELRNKRRLRPRTVHRHASTLRGAYQYALDEGILTRNPFARVRLPRIDKGAPKRVLSIRELRAFLQAAASRGVLEHAVLHTLAATGARVGAVCAADVADYIVDQGVPMLVTHGKGDKTGQHVLGPRAAQVLDTYLDGRRTGPLFTRDAGGRSIDPDWVRYRCQLIANDARLRAVSPHALRRSWVTHGLDAGVPLEVVQDGAGHADPATTRGYDGNRGRFDATRAEQLEAFRYGTLMEQPRLPGP